MDFGEGLAVEVGGADEGVGVVEVIEEESPADGVGAAKCIVGLGDEFFPVAAGGVSDVDRNDAAARGVLSVLPASSGPWPFATSLIGLPLSGL